MGYFDSEGKILLYFRDNFQTKDTGLSTYNSNLETVLDSVLEEDLWIDNSGKTQEPPDFYSSTAKLMMEVMRIDDHEKTGCKGDPINPTNARESLLQKESAESGILDSFPNVDSLFCIPNTGLPTEEDHSYLFYKNGFRRIVEKHVSGISNYRNNHPGYKLIFFVLDESSAYFESKKISAANDPVWCGKSIKGRPHFFFADRAFLEPLLKVDIDYLVWYAPFKKLESKAGLRLPTAFIYDMKHIDFDLFDYDEKRMISGEI